MKAGERYHALRNVVVIFITTYDPFSLDRMVYTVKNGCIEVPELPYEDGARTIFLYTQGTKGNPPESLRELLHYMEYSSKENAKTENLQKLHEMVTAVKRDGKVGLAYMKSFEIEERIREEGIAEGKAVGLAEGIEKGVIQGKINDILELLSDFGEIPSSLKEQITAQKDEEVLRVWLKLAAKAGSIEEFTRQLSM